MAARKGSGSRFKPKRTKAEHKAVKLKLIGKMKRVATVSLKKLNSNNHNEIQSGLKSLGNIGHNIGYQNLARLIGADAIDRLTVLENSENPNTRKLAYKISLKMRVEPTLRLGIQELNKAMRAKTIKSEDMKVALSHIRGSMLVESLTYEETIRILGSKGIKNLKIAKSKHYKKASDILNSLTHLSYSYKQAGKRIDIE